jgi:hypothetical protein
MHGAMVLVHVDTYVRLSHNCNIGEKCTEHKREFPSSLRLVLESFSAPVRIRLGTPDMSAHLHTDVHAKESNTAVEILTNTRFSRHAFVQLVNIKASRKSVRKF